VTPFFESKQQVDGKPQVVIYNARWEDVWPALGLSPKDVALCWADPPYGVAEQTNRGSKGRSNATTAFDWRPVVGDREPFSPALLLETFRRLVLWGANHYSSRLPDAACWWVWDKRDSMASNDNADCELAWTNLKGPARLCHHLWSGMIKGSERTQTRIHPTQKPVELSTWGFERAGLKPGQLVFAPYLGSGPEVRAAINMGLRIIGCDVDADYCRTVVDHRVALAAPRRGQEGQAMLFGDAS
jgi:site-specific DNA-methyltransferase (adenine-specific)